MFIVKRVNELNSMNSGVFPKYGAAQLKVPPHSNWYYSLKLERTHASPYESEWREQKKCHCSIAHSSRKCESYFQFFVNRSIVCCCIGLIREWQTNCTSWNTFQFRLSVRAVLKEQESWMVISISIRLVWFDEAYKSSVFDRTRQRHPANKYTIVNYSQYNNKLHTHITSQL